MPLRVAEPGLPETSLLRERDTVRLAAPEPVTAGAACFCATGAAATAGGVGATAREALRTGAGGGAGRGAATGAATGAGAGLGLDPPLNILTISPILTSSYNRYT